MSETGAATRATGAEGLVSRALWLVWLLRTLVVATIGLSAATVALILFVNWDEAGAFSSIEARTQTANVVDLSNGVLAIGYLLAFVVTVIAYCYWMNRAARIAARRAPEVMTISPGWAVGWCFIPIASLWMPLRAVGQAWRVSQGAGPSETLPGVFYLWWLPWLIANILGNVSFRVGGLEPTLAQMRTAGMIDLVANLALIVSCFALVSVVRRITDGLKRADAETVAVFA